MQWTIENMWAFYIQLDGTPLSNGHQMEYRPVEYERSTYVDINYCFENFKFAEGYVNISY
jgi:hypothetical protein